MSGSETEDWECPLCMEELDIDDRGFFPCECGYQICRFCHNRLSEDYGGRCPACRRLYSEQTPRWNPISPAQVAKIKNEKKAKERERREIESNSRRHLANVRVVQKNLVYVIGLPSSLATEDTLRSHDYFGQFGRINKIVVNRRQNGSSSNHPTVGVYVTYASRDDATRAINAVDGSMLESRVLRATFGTTKYCSYYLRNIPCQNPGCMYLHEPGEEADSFTKEDLAANRANLRESRHGSFGEDDDDDDVSGRADSRSPNAHTARAAVAAGGQHGSRPHTNAAAAAARARKASELGGLRSRSVDPHGDAHTGSALPATASWASRAVAKKPGDQAEGKARKHDSGGTITLRMVPASRGKAAKAAAAVASVSASNAGRDRTKSAAAAASVPATDAESAGSQHHPVLQQMSRERKQQLRHQTRAQQKAAEDATADSKSEPPKQAAKAAARRAEAAKEAEKPQPEAAVAAEARQESAPAAVEAPAPQLAEISEAPEEPAAVADVAAAQPAAAMPPRAAHSHENGALSFQTITDSLFAQLNAKVSTPAAESPLAALGSQAGLGSQPGLRGPGYPGTGVDPLLFSTTAAAPSDGGRLGGPFDAPQQFSLFGGQAPWGDGSGAYVQSPLSSLLGD
ncbi:transcriptional repressor general negative regulator of transcription subunit 4, partial [Coemansia sp. RSA 2610]